MCEIIPSSSLDSSCSRVQSPLTRALPTCQCMRVKVIVEIEGQRVGCVDTIPMEEKDISTYYQLAQDESQNPDWVKGLENQFIALRFLRSLQTSTMSVCVLYGQGKWDLEPRLNSSAVVAISNSYGLAWDVQDDPFDNYDSSAIGEFSETLWANNAWTAHKTDGICFGPITDNGEDVNLKFSYLSAMKGVILNTYDAESQSIDIMSRWYLNGATGRKPTEFNATNGRSLPGFYQKIDSIKFKSACTCNA